MSNVWLVISYQKLDINDLTRNTAEYSGTSQESIQISEQALWLAEIEDHLFNSLQFFPACIAYIQIKQVRDFHCPCLNCFSQRLSFSVSCDMSDLMIFFPCFNTSSFSYSGNLLFSCLLTSITLISHWTVCFTVGTSLKERAAWVLLNHKILDHVPPLPLLTGKKQGWNALS